MKTATVKTLKAKEAAATRLKLKRAYEAPEASDGTRFLVERLWPRGISKQAAKLDAWLKDAAPSDELRRWYGHDPEKWPEFRRRYFAELARAPEALAAIREALKKGPVTLVFAAKDPQLSNARALKELLERDGGAA
jgi:uncharacterized protein YeaO (DUF488 family)